MMRASTRLMPRPPEEHPPWRKLISDWLVAISDQQRFASLLQYYEHLCGPASCQKLIDPASGSNGLRGRATTLAKDIGTILSTYGMLRGLFAKLVREVRICCFAPGQAYDLFGDVLRIYRSQTETDLTSDEVLEMVLFILGLAMFRNARAVQQEEYCHWFAIEGKLIPIAKNAEQEAAYLVKHLVLDHRQVLVSLRNKSKVAAFDRRLKWVLDLCRQNGL